MSLIIFVLGFWAVVCFATMCWAKMAGRTID